MTFKELLKAEQERPAYLPPPSWASVQAYIAGLKAAVKNNQSEISLINHGRNGRA